MIEQFWLFHCGWFRVPRGAFEKGGGFDMVALPFLAAVAFHSELGPIVVDAPFGHEGPTNAGEVVGSFRVVHRPTGSAAFGATKRRRSKPPG